MFGESSRRFVQFYIKKTIPITRLHPRHTDNVAVRPVPPARQMRNSRIPGQTTRLRRRFPLYSFHLALCRKRLRTTTRELVAATLGLPLPRSLFPWFVDYSEIESDARVFSITFVDDAFYLHYARRMNTPYTRYMVPSVGEPRVPYNIYIYYNSTENTYA